MILKKHSLYVLIFAFTLVGCEQSAPPVGVLRVEPVQIDLA